MTATVPMTGPKVTMTLLMLMLMPQMPAAATYVAQYNSMGLVSPFAGLPKPPPSTQKQPRSAKHEKLAEKHLGSTPRHQGAKEHFKEPTDSVDSDVGTPFISPGPSNPVSTASARSAASVDMTSDIEVYNINPALLIEWEQDERAVVVEITYRGANAAIGAPASSSGDKHGADAKSDPDIRSAKLEGVDSSVSVSRLAQTDFEVEASGGANGQKQRFWFELTNSILVGQSTFVPSVDGGKLLLVKQKKGVEWKKLAKPSSHMRNVRIAQIHRGGSIHESVVVDGEKAKPGGGNDYAVPESSAASTGSLNVEREGAHSSQDTVETKTLAGEDFWTAPFPEAETNEMAVMLKGPVSPGSDWMVAKMMALQHVMQGIAGNSALATYPSDSEASSHIGQRNAISFELWHFDRLIIKQRGTPGSLILNLALVEDRPISRKDVAKALPIFLGRLDVGPPPRIVSGQVIHHYVLARPIGALCEATVTYRCGSYTNGLQYDIRSTNDDASAVYLSAESVVDPQTGCGTSLVAFLPSLCALQPFKPGSMLARGPLGSLRASRQTTEKMDGTKEGTSDL